jgi:flagellar basal-body rod modification protein FlgD
MDVRHSHSITGVGSQASTKVASSLAPRTATTNKTAGPAKPRSSPASNSSGDASDPSDITSSDFLTLLVSELQNQDPTQPADPNAYITQLVQVNSLQQLIQINQTTQLAGGDSVALLNDIDLTVDPSSSVASPPSSSGSDSGANGDAVAKSRDISSVNYVSGLEAGTDQNNMWGNTISS